MKLVTILFLLLVLFVSVASVGAVPQGKITEWVVLGPFPNPERDPKSKSRGAFDVDYLKPLGGEAKARIAPGKVVNSTGLDGKVVSAASKSVEAPGRSVDFIPMYPDNHYKLAYAYTELKSSNAEEITFLIGTDDGAKVWINGKIAYEFFHQGGRGFIARQDRFKAKLKKGVNTILVKVENTVGGWEFGIEAYDKPHLKAFEADIKRIESKLAMQQQDLSLGGNNPAYIYWAKSDMPRIIWRDVDEVRRLVGDVPLKVRWFDADLKEVKVPDKVGRYGATIEGKLRDGTPIKRALTFYCAPPEFNNWWQDYKLQVPYLGLPFDTDVWKNQSANIYDQAGGMYRDALFNSEDGAKLLAGITELKSKGITENGVTETPEVLNQDYQLALKLKVAGLAGKVRPLALPKLLSTPAKVLHEGTPAEAGVKPDAKKNIDAVCRQWAEESGEPFTILVARHGVIISHAAFGKDADDKPIDLGYRKDIASITKPLSGLLFSQFLDQGYVKLDDSVSKALPEFPSKGKHVLTFRQLFTHTSGQTGHGNWGGMSNPYLDNVILDGLDALNPGTRHEYNGMGYDLAGKAMEMMTGKSIFRLFHENLYRPLGIPNVSMSDLAYSAKPTAYELGILAQLLANHGSYGDKQFISEETFQKLLPVQLNKYYKGVNVEWGIGIVYYYEHKPGATPDSKDPKDLIFSPRVIGHGSATSCILRVDLEKDLVIVQVRRMADEKFGDYQQKFFMAIADSLL